MAEKQKTELLVKKLASKKIKSSEDFLKLKQKLAAELGILMPGNVRIVEIYKYLRKNKKVEPNKWLETKVKKRPVRSLSGVAVVAVLTKPWPCPGKCIYCPLEKGIPKSYLSGEPAVERAKLLKYDPYLQVKKRIETLEKIGHPADKIELIVIGGTWSYLPKQYQTWFITQCFAGANTANSKIKNQKSKLQFKNQNLEKSQKINEKARHRIIGLTLETRPDYIDEKEILRMRKFGATRVELGMQIADDKILKKNLRGHGILEIIKATRLLKNAGFKICYHIMPGLLGSNPRLDLARFKKIFSSPDFRPDMLKIYPCVVTKGAKLYELWKKGAYIPYTDQQLIELLIKMKYIVPPYVRINRIIRDIPSFQIEGGSKISNLRERVQEEMEKRGIRCRCIRCREIKSLRFKVSDQSTEHIKRYVLRCPGFRLIKTKYESSGGKEIFLSYENEKQNKLAAFLRLRLPHPLFFSPSPLGRGRKKEGEGEKRYKDTPLKTLQNTAIIREVHTYGQLIPIGKRSRAAQHLGLGKKLIKKAEKIARQSGYKKIAVISGIGARNYYRKLDYRLQDTYMVKSLIQSKSY